ncbi:hypothetical protein [Ramlibacter tataouinensis]|uniref:hypothetical protein n=1 Tax=Ramlibacter tataouinensis TaxID=94132 RepID=UPI001D12239B|nr:hypothetical protein [Ramlibacter tataouinensis]
MRNSIFGMLGSSRTPSDSVLLDGVEDIRESMLDALGDPGHKQFPQVIRRIRYADDIQALWYLRGDLMASLAALHGEVAARRKIAGITEQFHGLLPSNQMSRPSPLVN